MTANKSLWHRRKWAENELTCKEEEEDEDCAPFTAFFLAAKDYFGNGLILAQCERDGDATNPFATLGRLLELGNFRFANSQILRDWVSPPCCRVNILRFCAAYVPGTPGFIGSSSDQQVHRDLPQIGPTSGRQQLIKN